MAKAIFISPQYVKETTLVDQNADDKLLTVSIYDMQVYHIEAALGTDLYNKLKADVLAGSLAGDYLSLMCDYVQPALSGWVAMYVNYSMLQKYTNKSVSTKQSESASPVDYTRQRDGWDKQRDLAEYKTQRLINYLCANSSLFPEYSTNSGADKIAPKSNAYTTALYLGRGGMTNKEARKYGQ